MRRRTLSILVLGIALAAGFCLYESFAISRQRDLLRNLRQSFERLAAENRQLLDQRDAARGKLGYATDDASAKLTDAIVQDPTAAAAVGAWQDRAAQLKSWAHKMPDKTIPEFQFLTDDDWIAASKDGDLSTDIGARKTLNRLRQIAKDKFAAQLHIALQKYLAAHDNQLPTTMTNLQPYFDAPVNAPILARYAVTATGNANDMPGNGTLILERPEAEVDDIFNSQISLTLNGMTSSSTMPTAIAHTNEILQAAVTAYKGDHGGQKPTQLSDVQPYFTESVDENALQKIGWGWPTN